VSANEIEIRVQNKGDPMATRSVNLEVLGEACSKLASEFNEFWILAGLTDRSYEDGAKKGGFPKAIKRYASYAA
jgi:hypothetical protein